MSKRQQGGSLRAWSRRVRRSWRSRWHIRRARWRVWLQRRRPPKTALVLPSQPQPARTIRSLRAATLLASLVIMCLVAALVLRERQPEPVSAERPPDILREIVVLTPTPQPATPTATPLPTPTAWATPDPFGGGGTLAFTWERDGSSDIYLLPVGQSAPLRLTHDPAPDRQPAWRPDGREIAFSSHREGNWDLYVFNLEDGTTRRVTRDLAYDGAPSWSPDGRWLVYESYQDDNLDLYVVAADGQSAPQRLTTHAAHDGSPEWTPDGRHVIFTSRRAGLPDLFLVSLNATGEDAVVNLTNTPDVAEDRPRISAEANQLAFTVHGSNGDFVQVMDLDPALRPAASASGLLQQGMDAAWSPDGSAVVYVQQQDGQSYLVGSSAVWGVAPQAFAAEGIFSDLSWSALAFTPELAERLPSAEIEAAELFTEAVAVPIAGQPPVQLFELPVSAPMPVLSDKVDQSFEALRERVQTEAGWDYLGQLEAMFKELDTPPQPGSDGHSWNKAGRAFDLTYRDVLAFEPLVEVVREDRGEQTFWRVYLRAARQDGSQGEPLRDVPWDFRARFGDDPLAFDAGGQLKAQIPSGYYVDLTALAAAYGWQRTAAWPNWRTYFPGTQFWHFEKRDGLSWEEAMGEIYTSRELADWIEEP